MPIRSTNWRKYLIVKKATNAEVINPIKSCALKISKLAAIESPTKKINAPKMVGIAKRNANLEESLNLILEINKSLLPLLTLRHLELMQILEHSL